MAIMRVVRDTLAQAIHWLAWARRGEVLLALVATISFFPAILVPFFEFSPSLGEPILDALLLEAGYDFSTKAYSLLGGILALLQDGDKVIASVLLVFSVFFPVVKLSFLWQALWYSTHRSVRALRRLEHLGPWSMADVFVVSVLLLSFKSFPMGTVFTLRMGYYLFLASVCAGLLATTLTRIRLVRPYGHGNTLAQVGDT